MILVIYDWIKCYQIGKCVGNEYGDYNDLFVFYVGKVCGMWLKVYGVYFIIEVCVLDQYLDDEGCDEGCQE